MSSPAPNGSGSPARQTAAPGAAPDAGAAHSATREAIGEIIDSMEQGVLVWSQDGICQMYNQRVFDVLELNDSDLFNGMARRDFLGMAVARGEFDQATANRAERRFADLSPFSFDRLMPSGAVIRTTARPIRSGGFVVTFTDVTDTRRKEAELEAQRENFRAAEATANAALAEERARKAEARGLSQLDEWLQSCKSLDELLTIVSKFLSQLFPGSVGELYIYSNSRDVLDGACSWGIEAPRAHIQPDECWGLRRGRLYRYQPTEVSFTCTHVNGTVSDDFDADYICIPIIAHGDTVGLLHIRFGAPADPPEAAAASDGRIDYALRCSERISLAIANVRLRDDLREQSTKDPLTGLFNRRYFLDRCHRELSLAARNNESVGLISLDADHFKSFNDTHGHDAGDLVLLSISDTMSEMCRDDAIVARFGGEEFAILMPNTTVETCRHRAEALRKRIADNVLTYHGSPLPKVTVSVGLAFYPANGTTPRQLLREADRALYQAKDAGRNRVVMADDPATRETALR